MRMSPFEKFTVTVPVRGGPVFGAAVMYEVGVPGLSITSQESLLISVAEPHAGFEIYSLTALVPPDAGITKLGTMAL